MSLILSGTDGLSDVDGTAATPAIRGTDANTGIFFGTDIIGFSEGGVEAARINADSQFVAAAGTAALPVITTTGDLNTGIFFPAADTIAFSEGGVEAMRIDSSGNVGIGTTSPANVRLTLERNAGNLRIRNPTTRYRSDYGVNSAGATEINSYDDTGAVYMPLLLDANPLQFNISASEKARIDSSGNLLVGQTTQSATTNGFSVNFGQGATIPAVSVAGASSANAEVNYTMYSTSAAAYRFYVGYGGTVFATSIVITAISDQRLKENIRDIDTGLDAIMALKPRRFDWKEGKGQDKKDVAGFIAQEFETIFPECVGTSKAGADGVEYKNISHETLIPTLVKAIQEQQALITQLTARITALENK